MQVVSNSYSNNTITETLTSNFCTEKVRRQSELANHLGNVLVTVSDRKLPHETSTGIIDYYMADIVSSCDEYPGGMIMPGRNFSSDSYMFGHNGQEKDDEITGITGANYTAEFWEYDSRLIWRWNRDKVEKPWESPYACFADNPIWLVDKNGADTSFADNNSRQQFKKTYNEINDRIKK